MSQVPSQKFGAEYVAHLRNLLDIAAEQIGPEHRTSAPQAEIAETRLRDTENVIEAHQLTNAALPAGEDRTA
ncbi:hypothetical protein NB311A_05218 [Nitrobacter sp. Nb-311A]|uniref:hypothetical protein n=1 Tax=unclassified Nitrobacter TaxID=2620411 RepID=UPI00006870A6|nr:MULTISPECIES: hypothetical protein [unclassified Nitrobacter]EAQ35790.1 hypothetical protein NB311A_05218 [Nitrobacter sp. Nb-311A]MCB1393283.1 hypothetical protein [Nitrobacter sp.]MCV0386354.1 hypothetical protein [Nitrobacter sp.]